MSEMNQNLPPALRSAMDTFYTTPPPDPAFAEGLEAQLRQQQIELIRMPPVTASSNQKLGASHLTHRSSFMHALHTRPILAVIAAILALLLLTGIAYAVGRLAGFIPGVGFVQDVHSILETPVVVQREIIVTPTPNPIAKGITGTNTPAVTQTSIPAGINKAQPNSSATALSVEEKKGIIITVEQAVAEADRLVIAYKITGLPPNIFGPDRAEKLSAEQNAEDPFMVNVRIPDGTLLKLTTSGGNCGGGGDLVSSWLSCQLIRSPLPKGVNQFSLEIHRLPNALPGELPEDWVIPVNLTSVSSSGAATSLQELNLRSQPVKGITLRLIKVDQSPQQTAFQLAMEWEGSNRMVSHTAPVTLQDAQGRYYILTGGPDSGRYSIDNPNFATLSSLVTTPVDGSSPLTLQLDWIAMSATTRGDGPGMSAAILKFDPGKTAKVGQEWPIDQTFHAGDLDLHFTTARLKTAVDGSLTLEFDVQAPSGVMMVNLMPKENPSSSGSGYDKARGVMISRVTLPALPTQPVELYVSEIVYKVNGPWEITWQPQHVNTMIPTPVPAPTRLAPPPMTIPQGTPGLSNLQELLKHAYPDDLYQPGWYQEVKEVDLAENTGMLDTGDTPEQPLHSRVDAWYHLDQQGYARTTVYIRKSLDGKTLSTDIDNGIYHFSLPEGRGGISPDVYLDRPPLDGGVLAAMSGWINQGGTISQESVVINGVACQLFEATQIYNPPQVSWGEPSPIKTSIYSVCVDSQSGKVLQIQNKMVYADGSSRVRDTTRFISFEKVESLPDEVRQILEKVVIP